MLTSAALPEYPALAAYLLHTAAGISVRAGCLLPQNDDGLFHCDDQTAWYPLYKPAMAYLQGNDGMLNEERAQRISAASRQEGRQAVVFGPGKYIGQRDLTRMGVTFCQLPHETHRAEWPLCHPSMESGWSRRIER